MTNKELELIGQLTEVAMTVTELKAENKILKDINEKLMQVLRIHDVAGQSEQLLAVAEYVYNHFDDSSSKTAKDYLQEFLSQ